MTSVTIGGMVAGLLQFIVIMGIFLPPATSCISSSYPYNNIAPTTCAVNQGVAKNFSGIVSQSRITLNSSVLHNVSTEAQSNTTGVKAAINNPAYTIGGFLYAGLGDFLTALYNIPVMMYNIFSYALSSGVLFGVALAGVAFISMAVFSYTLFIIAAKVISLIQKVIAEDV